MEDLERRLGVSVRARRLAADVTQVELADRANVALASVKSLEAGNGATVRTLLRVIQSLDADDWIDALAPQAAFNPLDVLAAAQRRVPPGLRQRASRRRT